MHGLAADTAPEVAVGDGLAVAFPIKFIGSRVVRKYGRICTERSRRALLGRACLLSELVCIRAI